MTSTRTFITLRRFSTVVEQLRFFELYPLFKRTPMVPSVAGGTYIDIVVISPRPDGPDAAIRVNEKRKDVQTDIPASRLARACFSRLALAAVVEPPPFIAPFGV